MNESIDLSVITATYQRPALLSHCLRQRHAQAIGNLRVEHIVVSDGPDPLTRYLAEQGGARYIERSSPGGVWGAAALDLGIASARGDYVCFWDDDNCYEPHALATLFAAAHAVDLGVVQCRFLERQRCGHRVLPAAWEGTFHYRHIDTMCVCVRRGLAEQEKWDNGDRRRGTDWRWCERLRLRGATIRFVPVVIGEHL